MKILKGALTILFSLRTTIVLLLALLFFLLYGSFAMPLNEEFQLLNVVPLLQWMSANSFRITWWLWASIAVLALLTANTLFCSFESVIRKRGAKRLLLIIAPQVIHAGFLFILLAHLLSSSGGFRGTTVVSKGSLLQLPNGLTVLFDSIDADIDRSGYVRGWSTRVKYFETGREIAGDTIQPNSPSFRKGLGIYVKNIRFDPYPAALIEVSREPGAPWALAGGILFLAGTVTLLLLKIRREEEAGV